MKKLLLPVLVLLVSSCYTERVANKRVVKAQSIFPNVVAENCARFYPVKEFEKTNTIYKEGKTDTLTEFIEVDCDTVRETKYKDRVVKVPVTHYIKNTDTIKVTNETRVENTAKIESLQSQLSEQQQANSKLSQANKTNKTWLWIASGIAAILLALHLLRFYLKR